MFMPINEQLSFSVSFGGNVKASATATINDTSRPAYEYMLVGSNPSTTEITEIDIPTYTLASNKTSVNEGETIIFTLSTTMLDTGTVVPYTITGVALADLSSGALTGSFTTDATGKSVLQIQLANDNLTEGIETLTITLNGKNISKSVTINDTSVLVPTYDTGWYDDPTGANSKLTSANEGDIIFLVIKTTNVPNGTSVNIQLEGNGINIDDFNGNSLNDTFAINNNIGYMRCVLADDVVTEDTEILTAIAKINNVIISSSTISINDTSHAPYETIITPDSNITDREWHVVRGFNLADEFIRVIGRLPNIDEDIVLNIPEYWALIGSYWVTPGITIDNRFNSVKSITINNSGIISGIGGEGGGSDMGPQNGIGHRRGYPAQNGGTGIKNTSIINVIVNNHNLVSGGGGGEGADGILNQADTIHGGGGGIPYGWSNRMGHYKWLPLFKDWETYTWINPADYGVNGVRGNLGNSWGAPGLAGFVKEGNVTITNIGSGITKGR